MSLVSGRLARALSGIAATAAVAATLTLTQSTATAVEADGPNYQAPSVGKCRNYTITAAYKESNSTPVTACSNKHTAKTFVVGTLPEGVTWSSSADAIGNAVGDTCNPAFDKALGGVEKTRRMTAYTYFWFQPTAAQRDHGARWFRCDVALWGNAGILPMPSNANPLLRDGKLTYGVTRCLYGTKNYVTACSRSHHHRATGSFSFADGPYPGDTAIQRAVNRRCPSLTFTRTWMYVAPSRESWRYGDRTVVCSSKTSH